MPHRRTARLARWQIWLLCLSGVALWLSGGAWLLLHYFGQLQGEFGPQTNPLEPWMMKLHGLALFPALLSIGGMLIAHIPLGWSHQRQRVAGVMLCTVLALLMGTGYLLYYAGEEELRSIASLAHWVIGLTMPVMFIWHYLNGLGARISRSRGVSPQRSKHRQD